MKEKKCSHYPEQLFAIFVRGDVVFGMEGNFILYYLEVILFLLFFVLINVFF